ELSFQEFPPGSTNLLPAALASLDVLANALYERPELRLEIEGSADPLADLEAVRGADSRQTVPVQKWNAAANLLPAGISAAGEEDPSARSYWKVFSFEKGASARRIPMPYS